MQPRSELTLHPYDINTFIKETLGDPEKYEYMQKVYDLLTRLRPGKSINIDNVVEKENIEVFIKVVCCYYSEIGRGVQFSNDYTRVIKKQEFQFHGETYY